MSFSDIIARALADKLYPDGSVLGKPIYLDESRKPSTVIGIVESLQVPWPGQLMALAGAVPNLLYRVNRMRVIPEKRGERTFAQIRADAYKSDRGMALLMGVICFVLLMTTAAGIVGLTTFWVGQRRRQIGVRRALGATAQDILQYFLIENLLIGLGGALAGAARAAAGPGRGIGASAARVTCFAIGSCTDVMHGARGLTRLASVTSFDIQGVAPIVFPRSSGLIE